MANKEKDVIRFSNDTASLTPNKDVDTTCLVPSENVFSEVVEKVSDIDNTAKKIRKISKDIKKCNQVFMGGNWYFYHNLFIANVLCNCICE